MAKAYEELELRDDFMFGVIMRDPKYCKPFLETILGIKIRKLEYPESQKSIDLSAGAKGVRLDVYGDADPHQTESAQTDAVLSGDDRLEHSGKGWRL